MKKIVMLIFVGLAVVILKSSVFAQIGSTVRVYMAPDAPYKMGDRIVIKKGKTGTQVSEACQPGLPFWSYVDKQGFQIDFMPLSPEPALGSPTKKRWVFQVIGDVADCGGKKITTLQLIR